MASSCGAECLTDSRANVAAVRLRLDGSAGLYRLKEELTRRVNTAVAPNKVTAVLFKEIVVK